MEKIDLLVHSAAQVCVAPDHDGPQRGARLGDLGLIENGAVAVHAGRIVAVGESGTLRDRYRAVQDIDASGRAVTPGFVDPHTHLPWVGERAAEFEQRVGGATYMEIMAAGGGIMATVRATRAASVDELVAANLSRLRRMLSHGTTSAECKTGYGLNVDTEIRQLTAIKALSAAQPVELTPTFLPAHAIPPDDGERADDVVNRIINEMLPAADAWSREMHQPLFVDVFCEQGVFDVAQTRRIFEAAQGRGFRLKIHADEFVGLGGTRLAVEMGAISADHLVHTPAEDIVALGASETVAVALPGTPFGLGHRDYTPAKAILDAGGALALATDLNPGTCWCESMPMMMALATRYMGLTPAQALVAATLNAAYAIGRGREIGSLTPGRQADLLILAVDDYRHLSYRFGSNLVAQVIKSGRLVVSNR